MEDKQYDISSKFRKLFDEKQKQRMAAKEYFQNYIYNPHRPPNDAPPFDVSLHRFSAMSAYHAENYKPSARHWARYILFLAPFGLVSWHLRNYKKKEEEMLRSGVVKYSDRQFKLIF